MQVKESRIHHLDSLDLGHLGSARTTHKTTSTTAAYHVPACEIPLCQAASAAVRNMALPSTAYLVRLVGARLPAGQESYIRHGYVVVAFSASPLH